MSQHTMIDIYQTRVIDNENATPTVTFERDCDDATLVRFEMTGKRRSVVQYEIPLSRLRAFVETDQPGGKFAEASRQIAQVTRGEEPTR